VGRGIFDRLEGELAAREKSPGLSFSDMLALPDPLDSLCMWMVRQSEVSMGDVVDFLEQDEQLAHQCLGELLDRGFIREVAMEEMMVYQVRLAPIRKREMPLDLWQALQDKVEGEEDRP
jgi:hypothetical protein